ncbi:transglutaminase TgpA family protein [Allonocardiopsis opalescens]|uniref:Transglutaminase superfamily protein n=1 Tax=Allonocardiopsis opalescens TaxID=1144618 RepID=A0A2T0Q3T9_9ACTN|nr:DUF3488 and transglutaminase-like domain-containing protein [Allonocardiopsis opalescens]PRX98476.1 transglutaminase superfamily protein [Allonocardiopsis opalescens]
MKYALTLAAALASAAGMLLLQPVFQDSRWLGPALLVIAAATAFNVILRYFNAPEFVVVIVQPVGAGLLLYVGAEACIFLFSGQSLSGDPLAEIGADIARYAPPVPTTPAMMLLTACIAAGVAWLVDVLVVAVRSAVLTGLLLLALYSAPLTLRQDGGSAAAFALVAAAYLALLLLERWDTVTAWGRAVPVRSRRRARARADADAARGSLALSGLRLSAVALACALLLPSCVPALRGDGLFGLSQLSTPSVGGTVTTPHPLASLRQNLIMGENAPVLSYRTDDPDAPYLRMHVLDTFDGTDWTMSPVRTHGDFRVSGDPLPPPAGMDEEAADEGEQVVTDVSVYANVTRMGFLPLPYPPRGVEIEGEWYADPETLMVFSTEDTAGGLSYRSTSTRVDVDAAALAAAAPTDDAGLDRYLELPEVAPEVREVTGSVTEAADTPYEAAQALQEYFADSGLFSYDLRPDPAPAGVDPLAHFLTQRSGYCQHFASAMAVMARLSGIPARVAVGYTAGSTSSSGMRLVTTRDAHAWPELYFEGYGWLRFEPTPGGFGGQGTASTPDYAAGLPSGGSPTDAADPDGAGGAEPALPDQERQEAEEAPRDREELTGPGAAVEEEPTGWELAAGPAAVGAALLLALALPRTLRLWLRRRRWASAADDSARARAAWLELRDDVLDHGAAWHPDDSPRTVARRLAVELRLPPPAADALRRVALAEETARYAPAPSAPAGLRADSTAVRRALAERAGRIDRLRAALAPRSLPAAVGRALRTLRERGTRPGRPPSPDAESPAAVGAGAADRVPAP